MATQGETLALPSTSRLRSKASTVSISGGVAVLRSNRLDLATARAARQHGAGHDVYGSPRGDPQLRSEISRRVMRVGHVLSPDDVIITNG